jgi:uncharacterized secreted protein with C-terminal beta-propeller domain
MRDISKVENNGDRIYVLDKRGNSIFIFDNDGKYVGKISNLGRGPGEYLYIQDFQVFDGDIYIMETSKRLYTVSIPHNQLKYGYLCYVGVEGYSY